MPSKNKDFVGILRRIMTCAGNQKYCIACNADL